MLGSVTVKRERAFGIQSADFIFIFHWDVEKKINFSFSTVFILNLLFEIIYFIKIYFSKAVVPQLMISWLDCFKHDEKWKIC